MQRRQHGPESRRLDDAPLHSEPTDISVLVLAIPM